MGRGCKAPAKETLSARKKNLVAERRAGEATARKQYHQFLAVLSKHKRSYKCPLCGSINLHVRHEFRVSGFFKQTFELSLDMFCAKCGVGFKDGEFTVGDPNTMFGNAREVFRREVHFQRYVNKFKQKRCKYCGGKLGLTITRFKELAPYSDDLSLRVRVACDRCGAFGEAIRRHKHPQITHVEEAYEHYKEWQKRFMESLKC